MISDREIERGTRSLYQPCHNTSLSLSRAGRGCHCDAMSCRMHEGRWAVPGGPECKARLSCSPPPHITPSLTSLLLSLTSLLRGSSPPPSFSTFTPVPTFANPCHSSSHHLSTPLIHFLVILTLPLHTTPLSSHYPFLKRYLFLNSCPSPLRHHPTCTPPRR